MDRSGRAGVHVVVLNWQDAARTTACIEALDGLELVTAVTVVDNESDGSLRASVTTSGLDALVIEVAENRGFAGGMNLGLRSVLDSGHVGPVLCINIDATLDAGSLAVLVRELESDARLAMVGPALERASAGPVWFDLQRRRVRVVPTRRTDPVFVSWACVLLDPAKLREVGLLDEAYFMYWEDVEIGVRVTEAGFACAVVPHARYRHEVNRSHGRAGHRIATYSALGLLELADRLGGLCRTSARMRVGARWWRAVVWRRDRSEARAIWTAWTLHREARREPSLPMWVRLARHGVTGDPWDQSRP